ncbi:DUF4862 family protein [Arthrobacter sp. C152]
MGAPEGFFIGAYAAAPALAGWDPAAEAAFLQSVLELDGAAGLELPYAGTLHKYDEDWLFRRLPAGARFILTTIPGTMERLAADPGFGLASTSPDGRRDAVSFVREAHRAAGRLSDALGRPAVHAIQLHGAPVASPGKASAAALAASLEEIAAWEWDVVHVLLEHCDALMPGRPPAKGFLPLEEEIAAVREANEAGGRPVSIAINWARSVIEQRRPEAGLEHVQMLRGAGLLGGFTVSGCAGVDTRYGKAWADVHVPPAPADGHGWPDGLPEAEPFEDGSLLTRERLSQCLHAAGPQGPTGFRAIKVAAPPGSTVEQRVAAIAGTLDLARSVSAAACKTSSRPCGAQSDPGAQS